MRLPAARTTMMPIPARAHPGMPPEVPGIAGGATVVVVTITAAPSVMERWDWVATGAWVETVPVPESTHGGPGYRCSCRTSRSGTATAHGTAADGRPAATTTTIGNAAGSGRCNGGSHSGRLRGLYRIPTHIDTCLPIAVEFELGNEDTSTS